MSEYPAINLVLGIIGTVTGVIGLFVSYWIYRREKPSLEIKVLKCEHDFTVSKEQVKSISFWTDFLIKNKGDRGTTMIDMELAFEVAGQQYELKKQYYRDRYVNEKRIWISPHETLDLSTGFWGAFTGSDEEQIDCTFTIYHTHGAERMRAVSQRRKEESKLS
jgi:hypothetical protein